MNDEPYFNNVFCSVDGTDCPIQEPRPFDTKWYSHKLNGPGVRYEIGLSGRGLIIWVHGPFRCGEMNDLSIFRSRLQHVLGDESVIADSIYKSEKCLIPSDVFDNDHVLHSRIRARHETVNSRFKNFQILHHTFRHDVTKHSVCFHAVAQLVAIMTKTSNPLFQI